MAEIVHHCTELMRNSDRNSKNLVNYLEKYGCAFYAREHDFYKSGKIRYFSIGNCTVHYIKEDLKGGRQTEHVSILGSTKEIVKAEATKIVAAVPSLKWAGGWTHTNGNLEDAVNTPAKK